jgi:hypothetical protein
VSKEHEETPFDISHRERLRAKVWLDAVESRSLAKSSLSGADYKSAFSVFVFFVFVLLGSLIYHLGPIGAVHVIYHYATHRNDPLSDYKKRE